jgi:hypothetical protein
MGAPYNTEIPFYELLDILPHWRRKGVMRTAPAAVSEKFFVRIGASEKREFCDPEEVGFLGFL